MTKAARIDLSRAADQLRLVLLDDEREKALKRSERAALTDAREVLQSVLLRDAGRELARVG